MQIKLIELETKGHDPTGGVLAQTFFEVLVKLECKLFESINRRFMSLFFYVC